MVNFLLLNILMVLAANTAAYTYFGKGNFSRQLVTTFLLFMAQVTVSVLYLGLVVKDLRLGPLILFNAIISFAVLFVYRKNFLESVRESWRKGVDFLKFLVESRDYFLYFFIFLFGFQLFFLLLKMYHLPPSVWDVFTYHLHPVVEWYQRDLIPVVLDSPVDRVNFKSLGSGMFHFWVLEGFRDLTWIELPQFIYGLMLLVTSYAVMLKLNVSRSHALRYALLIYFIPAVLVQSGTCQNHLVLTTLILMTALYMMEVFYEKKYHLTFFMSLALGLLLGTKLNSLQIIFIFFLALLLSKGFKKNKIILYLKESKFTLITGAFAALIIGGFWHTRNIILYHNLLGPYVPDVSRADSFLAKLLNMGETFINNVSAFPFRITDVTTNYLPDLNSISGFGIQFFVFGTVAYFMVLLLILRKKIARNSQVAFLLIFPVLLLLSYFVYYFTPYNYRLFMFFPVFGIILWAHMSAASPTDKKAALPNSKGNVYLDVLISVMILFNMAACLFPGHIYRETYDWNTKFIVKNSMDEMNAKWKILFTTKNPMDRTAIKYFPYISNRTPNHWLYIDTYIPPWEPIGYVGEVDSWILPYFDNGLKRRIYHLRSLPGFRLTGKNRDTIDFSRRFTDSLKRRNIHYIHINLRKDRLFIKDKDVTPINWRLFYYDWGKGK